MKAATRSEAGAIVVEEIAAPALSTGEVRIKVEVALLERAELDGGTPGPLGCCYAGTIIELGENTTGWSVGDRVTGAAVAPCGECPLCLHEQEGLCIQPESIAGACAEELVIPARHAATSLQRLQAATDPRLAALAGPFARVVQGVAECRLWPGDRVLVVGANAVAMMFVSLAHHLGCHVTVADAAGEPLQQAGAAGAHHVVTVEAGLAAAVRDCPALGHGYDVVLETTGRGDRCGDALSLVRRGGVMNLFAERAHDPTIAFDSGQLFASGITVKAAYHHTPQSVEKAVEFIERGVLNGRSLFGDDLALDELSAAASNLRHQPADLFLPILP